MQQFGGTQQMQRDGVSYRNCLVPLGGAFVFSGIINLLALTASVFMIEVYDRVIPSKSVPTLIALLLLTAGLYGFSGLLDVIRGRVMTRIAAIMDGALTKQVFAVISGVSLRTRISGDVLKPAQDLEQIRAFVGLHLIVRFRPNTFNNLARHLI
jgi:ATP-binding cassette, subfamily C, bacterial PrsD